jgi:hypothetical protein
MMDPWRDYICEWMKVKGPSQMRRSSSPPSQVCAGQYLKDRAKIVRKDFLQSDEFDTHWMKKGLTKNIVLY